MYTLYHYLHCPFCIRIRLTFGALKIPYESKIIPNADEKTLLKLSGKKMVPIITGGHLNPQQSFLDESLDIMRHLDKDNLLGTEHILKNTAHFQETELVLNRLGGDVFPLGKIFWPYMMEFKEEDRNYFIQKKNKSRPYQDIIACKQKHEEALLSSLQELENYFHPPETLSYRDILIAAHLWAIYLVPEFRPPEKVHYYLQDIKKKTEFDFLELKKWF